MNARISVSASQFPSCEHARLKFSPLCFERIVSPFHVCRAQGASKDTSADKAPSVSAAGNKVKLGSSSSSGGASGSSNSAKGTPSKRFEPIEYKFYAQFQSHEPEFDCLKSLEIEEKVNMIRFGPRQHHSLFLLSNNDKTIKLWKVSEKRARPVASMLNVSQPADGGGGSSASALVRPTHASQLRIPSLSSATAAQLAASPASSLSSSASFGVGAAAPSSTIVAATSRRSYQNAHAYHINSISINSDGETFLSADDLRINLWNLHLADQAFNIVDIKPPNMEELTEVITAAAFHPAHCHTFMYSSSRGTIRLGDLRAAALCDRHSKAFEVEEDPAQKSFFSEIVSSISDVKFSADGRFIVARDYMTIKVRVLFQ